MWVFRANVLPRPAAGEGDCFLVHALCLSVKVSGEFQRLRKTLASTFALPPISRKIIKRKSQGATPGHRTLQSPNSARCDTDTSHPATLSCRTLRHRAISPCHFRLSHPATQKAPFEAPKKNHPFPAPPSAIGLRRHRPKRANARFTKVSRGPSPEILVHSQAYTVKHIRKGLTLLDQIIRFA